MHSFEIENLIEIADAISNYTARRVATCSWQRSM